ncbi:uncharacterized protein LOC128550026 [Mercenaria mercenaria]|uniref:uncharacterized protein LOC128550026 n=1 Tax=Mercenaria mercenaria TaxID=6596 RepID=UPI00234F203A|nr:uncharacterized protein LOC128550026 [Mercenaria mercenaria]
MYSEARLYTHQLSFKSSDGRSSNGEISTGLDTKSMVFAAFICGQFGPVRSVNMKNILARYIKYEQIYTKNLINMCEMKVFGKLVGNVDATSFALQKPAPVDGQWGTWESWSPICYCNATRPRRRACDSPSPYFSGQPCIGSDTSYRKCSPDANCSIHNVALGKTAYMSSLYLSHTAGLGIDGDFRQNPATCFHTEYDYQPWWLVDLHEVYYLHHIVMYDFITNATRTRSIEVAAGPTKCNMASRYFKCGEPMFHSVKTIDLLGTVARYVKLQMIGIKEFFHLCEVEIYGQKSRGKKVEDNCGDQRSIDGNWSTWSPWTACSEDCGTGNKTRTRTCTAPVPANGGKYCTEDDTDIISCRGSENCPYCSEEFGKCYSLFPQLTNWRYGGEACWHRGMKLVSIRSKAELKFVKSLLRENRYIDNQPIPVNGKLELHINASYFTHIEKAIHSLQSNIAKQDDLISSLQEEGKRQNDQIRAPLKQLHGEPITNLSDFNMAIADELTDEIQEHKEHFAKQHDQVDTHRDQKQQPDQKGPGKPSRRSMTGVQPVAFQAVVSPDTVYHIGLHQKIVFDSVHLNIGGGFHNLNGVFIAPRKGIYLFATSILSEGDSSIDVNIMKNGHTLAGGFAQTYGQASNDQGSVTAAAQLNVGDEVWVENRWLSDTKLRGHGSHSSFTGVLTQPWKRLISDNKLPPKHVIWDNNPQICPGKRLIRDNKPQDMSREETYISMRYQAHIHVQGRDLYEITSSKTCPAKRLIGNNKPKHTYREKTYISMRYQAHRHVQGRDLYEITSPKICPGKRPILV